MAHKLLNRVRAKWAEDVDASGAWSDELTSGVLVTFKRLQAASGADPTDDEVAEAVWASDEGVKKQRQMVDEVWALVSDGSAPPTNIYEALAPHKTVEALTPAAEALYADPAPRTITEEQTTAVDWAWSDAFAAEYGRDPRVPEYVYLRSRAPVRGDPSVMRGLAAVHASAFAALSDVHREYLASELSEAQFVRSYVPAVYDNAAAVAEDAVMRVTESAAYAAAMRARLCHLYELLFDVPLAEGDAQYLFEVRVRSERMPLTTDRLDGLVTAFREEAEEHAADARSAYESLLLRAPTDREAKAQAVPYRIDARGARAALLEELVAGLEFADVVRRAVLAMHPDLAPPDVFAIVAKVVAAFPATLREREASSGGGESTLAAALKAEIRRASDEAL
jgi:hypothetical protein